jgi:ribosomal protein L5
MTVYQGPDAAKLAGEALRQFVKEQPKAELNALRRSSAYIRRQTIKAFTATGVGRAIYGVAAVRGKARGRTKALKVVFPMPRVEARDAGWMLSLTLKGFAALTEIGGRTKPHAIESRDGVLTFKVNGSEKFGKKVKHPGSQMPAQPYLQRAADASLPVLQKEMDEGLAELADRVVG